MVKRTDFSEHVTGYRVGSENPTEELRVLRRTLSGVPVSINVDGWEDASTRWLKAPEYDEWVYVGMLDANAPWINDETGECNFIYIDPFYVYKILKNEWFSVARDSVDNPRVLQLPRGLYHWRCDGSGRVWHEVAEKFKIINATDSKDKQEAFYFVLSKNVCSEGAVVRYKPVGKMFSYCVALNRIFNGLCEGVYVGIVSVNGGINAWSDFHHKCRDHASDSWFGIRGRD